MAGAPLARSLHLTGSMPTGDLECLKGVYVVVVEEGHDGGGVLVNVLQYCGALARGVSTAGAALAAINLVKPDALVCDLASAAAESRRLMSELGGAGYRIPAIAVVDGEDGTDGFRRRVPRPLDALAFCRLVAQLVEEERGDSPLKLP